MTFDSPLCAIFYAKQTRLVARLEPHGAHLHPYRPLSLQMSRDLAWLSLLTAVRNTLTSLRLHLVQPFTIQHPQITLPALKCLDIQLWLDDPPIWPLDLKTPVLETYLEFSYHILDEPQYHEDTYNVRQMRSHRLPALSSYPLLEILQLEVTSDVDSVLTTLASNESLSPNLREIELATYLHLADGHYDIHLLRVNQHRPIPVQVVVTLRPGRELPYVIKNHPVRRILAIISHSHQGSSAEIECLATSVQC
jgi:hypothetical protein